MTVLLGLLLMPVLFRHLSRNELGVWLLLGQTWAGLAVLDFGFGTILVRRIALAAGRSGTAIAGDFTLQSSTEIADLFATGRRVYRWIAAGAFVVSFAPGFFYLGTLDLAGLSSATVWTAWGILCLSQALGIWASVWTCLLQGLGYVGWDALASSVVNSVTLLAQIGLVLLGGNLVGLAAIAAAGALAQRALIIRLVQTRRSELLSQTGVWREDLLRAMISPAFRAWLTGLGYLLVANTDQFFIAAYRGASAIPAYRAAFLLVLNLHLLAGVFCAPSQVFVSRFWQAGDLDQIHRIPRRNARIGLLSMCCGAGVILALGPALFELWLGRGNFVGYGVLGIFLATFILEHHANVFASCARATDDEAYAVSSLAGGALKVGLAVGFTSWLGLPGLALSTLVAQGLTNDWFMVYRSLNRLRIDFADHVRAVLVPCLLMFVAALLVGLLVDNLLGRQGLLIRVGTVSAVAAVLLSSVLWCIALDTSQRDRILRRVERGF